jgi:hypothetical protein
MRHFAIAHSLSLSSRDMTGLKGVELIKLVRLLHYFRPAACIFHRWLPDALGQTGRGSHRGPPPLSPIAVASAFA